MIWLKTIWLLTLVIGLLLVARAMVRVRRYKVTIERIFREDQHG